MRRSRRQAWPLAVCDDDVRLCIAGRGCALFLCKVHIPAPHTTPGALCDQVNDMLPRQHKLRRCRALRPLDCSVRVVTWAGWVLCAHALRRLPTPFRRPSSRKTQAQEAEAARSCSLGSVKLGEWQAQFRSSHGWRLNGSWSSLIVSCHLRRG